MHGRVIKVFGKYYTVKYNGNSLNCILRGKIRNDKRLKRFSEPVVTGDFVDFEINEDGSGVINYIHERKNVFSRKDKGRNKEDILAANLNLIIIIQSIKEPRLNLRFVDRLMVRAIKEDIPVVLCINKTDLAVRKEIKYVKFNGSKYYDCLLEEIGLKINLPQIEGRQVLCQSYNNY